MTLKDISAFFCSGTLIFSFKSEKATKYNYDSWLYLDVGQQLDILGKILCERVFIRIIAFVDLLQHTQNKLKM